MAESDPRKLRPFGRSSEQRDFETEDDPLVELARIVSEDRGAPAARPARPAPPPVEPVGRSAYSADLEAELMQELESSFAPRPPARPAPRAAAPTPQQPSAPQQVQPDESDHLLRSIEAELGDHDRRVRPAPPARPAASPADDRSVDPRPTQTRRFDGDADTASSQQGWEPVAAPTPFPRLDSRQRVQPASVEPPARQDRVARAPDDGQAAARRAPERPGPSYSREAPAVDETGSRLPLRRRDRPDAQDAGGAPRAQRSVAALPAAGWNNVIGEESSARGYPNDYVSDPADYRGEMRTTFGDLDESHPGESRPGDSSAGMHGELVSELEPSYSDPTFGTHWDHGEAGLDGRLSDEPRVAPARSPDGEARAARRPERRSRKGLLAAAGVLGVLVLGGAVLGLMRTGEDAPAGPPPVIAAPAGDTKVAAPEQQQAEAETAGEAVYNRVAGAAPSTEEQVVEGAEEPREISRIVLPPPQAESDDELVKAVGDETVVGSAPAEAVAIGPRRVRTYVVRPDGTISASGAAPAPEPAPPQQVAAVQTPIEPVRVATTSVRVGDAPAIAGPATPASPAPAAVATEPAAAAEPPAAPAPAPAAEAQDIAESQSPAASETEAAVSEPAPAAVAAEPPPAPLVAEPPAQVASVAPADPAAAAPAAAPQSGGYVMQVSSQRSMSEAQSTLAVVKQRYASILGNLETEVQEANLGAKGVYYRARVGRWATRAEAVEVCEALQAAGGTCFVTQ